MTARRTARARTPPGASTVDGIPTALAIGRCVEVWADPASGFPEHSARIRFNTARAAWLAAHGVEAREGHALIPNGAPWSLTHGHQPHHINTRDLAALARQAQELISTTTSTTPDHPIRKPT